MARAELYSEGEDEFPLSNEVVVYARNEQGRSLEGTHIAKDSVCSRTTGIKRTLCLGINRGVSELRASRCGLQPALSVESRSFAKRRYDIRQL